MPAKHFCRQSGNAGAANKLIGFRVTLLAFYG
jgi:hypothetical protein